MLLLESKGFVAVLIWQYQKMLCDEKGVQGVGGNIHSLPVLQRWPGKFLFHGLYTLGETENGGEFFDTLPKDRIRQSEKQMKKEKNCAYEISLPSNCRIQARTELRVSCCHAVDDRGSDFIDHLQVLSPVFGKLSEFHLNIFQ